MHYSAQLHTLLYHIVYHRKDFDCRLLWSSSIVSLQLILTILYHRSTYICDHIFSLFASYFEFCLRHDDGTYALAWLYTYSNCWSICHNNAIQYFIIVRVNSKQNTEYDNKITSIEWFHFQFKINLPMQNNQTGWKSIKNSSNRIWSK